MQAFFEQIIPKRLEKAIVVYESIELFFLNESFVNNQIMWWTMNDFSRANHSGMFFFLSESFINDSFRENRSKTTYHFFNGDLWVIIFYQFVQLRTVNSFCMKWNRSRTTRHILKEFFQWPNPFFCVKSFASHQLFLKRLVRERAFDSIYEKNDEKWISSLFSFRESFENY